MMNNPYPYSDTNKRYYTFDYYTKHRFGGKCAKAPLDIGCTCPNKDGTCGTGGCIYCRDGSRSAVGETIREQYENAAAVAERKWKNLAGMIPYFQSGTNTYGDLAVLRRAWAEAAAMEGAVMIGIGTRADCLGEDVLDALAELAAEIPVMVELGLQTVHDETAVGINRGYNFACFMDGYTRLKARADAINGGAAKGYGRLSVGIHLIGGLPGEDRDMMLESARRVADMEPDLVKIHLLHILRETPMAALYERGLYTPLERDPYCEIVCRQLELLPEDTIIGRITGDGRAEDLIAPQWSRRKTDVANTIDKMQAAADTWQGKLRSKN
ncbi:MAG: TIGR01212 family radical SAM protein [Ruminococcaceae bacterium]|nr:TIGR01212 family radical SAM protein [Oscillospiraceae bacterium]